MDLNNNIMALIINLSLIGISTMLYLTIPILALKYKLYVHQRETSKLNKLKTNSNKDTFAVSCIPVDEHIQSVPKPHVKSHDLPITNSNLPTSDADDHWIICNHQPVNLRYKPESKNSLIDPMYHTSDQLTRVEKEQALSDYFYSMSGFNEDEIRRLKREEIHDLYVKYSDERINSFYEIVFETDNN